MGRPRGLTVVIPAAGAGRRLKRFGPRPLIRLDENQTVVERQAEVIRAAFPRAEVVLVVGHEAEKVIKVVPRWVKVVENEGHEATNVLRSLCMGLRVASHERVLLVDGDLVFNREAISRLASGRSSALVDSRGQIAREEVGATVVKGGITRFDYGLDTKWAHAAFLEGLELDAFRGLAADPGKRGWFAWEALNAVIEHRGGRVRAVEPEGCRVVEIDQIRDIQRARRMAAEGGR